MLLTLYASALIHDSYFVNVSLIDSDACHFVDVDRLLSEVETICEEANVPLSPQRSASQMTSTAAPKKRSDSTDEGPPEKVAKSYTGTKYTS